MKCYICALHKFTTVGEHLPDFVGPSKQSIFLGNSNSQAASMCSVCNKGGRSWRLFGSQGLS